MGFGWAAAISGRLIEVQLREVDKQQKNACLTKAGLRLNDYANEARDRSTVAQLDRGEEQLNDLRPNG